MSSVVAEPVLSEQPSEGTTLFRLTDRLYRARREEEVFDAALDAIAEGLGCCRASILLFDESGVMRFVAARGLSDSYQQRLQGHTPWQPGARDPQPVIVPDIVTTDEPDWVKEAVLKEGIRALAFIPLMTQDGTVGKFMTYYDAPRNFSGQEIDFAVMIARQLGFCLERMRHERSRRSAEQQMRDSEERFRLMSEHAPVMIWMSTPEGKCLHLNRMLRDFWGVEEADIAGFSWGSTMHPEDAVRIGEAIGGAMARRESLSIVGRYRNTQGQYRYLQTDARPRVVDGEFLGMIGVNIDITEREMAEAERRKAEMQRELLIAELNHRVKNTLAIVQAIAHQTFRGSDDDEACSAFDGRLRALAHAHDLLTHANWAPVSFRELALRALQNEHSSEARVLLDGPDVELSPRQAVSLGLALHELFTNAMKFGALSTADGRVALNWKLPENGTRLAITWQEQGGPPVAPPQRKGFGSLLLQRTLRGDLDADVDLDFRPDGLYCAINSRRDWGNPARVA